MFRSVCSSYRLFNGLAISCNRICRPALAADDVTKCSAGLLHQAVRDSHCGQPQDLPTHKPCVTSCFQPFSHRPGLASFKPALVFQPAFPGLSTTLHVVSYATNQHSKPELTKSQNVSTTVPGDGEVAEEKLSIFKRFKRAYKEHGKILVAVHVATSIVWYGSFFALARGGVDIVPLMEEWGFSETVIKPFRAGGLGDYAIAYLMYKLATPARYTVTLAGTNFVIRYRRSKGSMAPKSQEDSLRELYKEGRQRFRNSKLRQDRLKKVQAAREKKKRGMKR